MGGWSSLENFENAWLGPAHASSLFCAVRCRPKLWAVSTLNVRHLVAGPFRAVGGARDEDNQETAQPEGMDIYYMGQRAAK
jgi:hypothetical protein